MAADLRTLKGSWVGNELVFIQIFFLLINTPGGASIQLADFVGT
jgi:hypothetical protein